jgi:hypothetical protein
VLDEYFIIRIRVVFWKIKVKSVAGPIHADHALVVIGSNLGASGFVSASSSGSS